MKTKILLILLLAFTLSAQEKIQLTMGESRIVQVDSPKKIAVGDPKIADIKVVSDKEILLIGKAAGTTSLIVWGQDNSQITSQVLVLSADMEKIMIEVNVQVMEVTKNNSSDFGINWAETVSALDVAEKTIPPIFGIADFERLKKIEMKVNSLIKNGYAKVLAKPRLLAISGSKASFLSGGELPVLYTDSQRISVEWKEYGVKLEIKPTADSAENINVDMKVEVSNLDAASGVNFNGNVIRFGGKQEPVDKTA